MKKLRICIIGAGNISNTRHIPAVLKNRNLEIMGIISDDEQRIRRTKEKYKFIDKVLFIDNNRDIITQIEKCEWFMNEVDAVIIGAPPKQHFPLTKAALTLKKHTLVEKPMMMNAEECNEVMAIAEKNRLVLNVMHSFQFSDGMLEMVRRYKLGEFGKVKSIFELQLTNRNRRLPIWYNELPLGLFYDEAAHFFYSARRIGGELNVINAHAQMNHSESTPRFLQVQLRAGDVPVQMYMNFNSPICEWGFVLICEKKIAIYDYFKDILIILNNDGQHLAKDVLRTSISFSYQFWSQFIKKGLQMVNHKLLYGHDKSVNAFINGISDGKKCFELSAELGREVVQAMNDVVKCVKKDETII